MESLQGNSMEYTGAFTRNTLAESCLGKNIIIMTAECINNGK